jgi:uncharacterized protein (TIGR01777 family)
MRILISGSHGFIGSACTASLRGQGHEVFQLVRRRRDLGPGSIFWDPKTGDLSKEEFEGFDAVLHFSGENIAKKRWSDQRKKELFQSRCRDTWLLSQVLLRLNKPPKVLITASAVGFYGNRGDEPLTEESPQGKGFLADLCGKWEEATSSLRERGVRVVPMRFGTVLSAKGGMLAKIVPLYRLGLGAVLGTGKQWMSWIALEDLLLILRHVLTHASIEGVVNVTSPFPVRQGEFALLLAKRVHRKVLLRFPAMLLRMGLGQISDELLLASVKAYPNKLLEHGYSFKWPTLEMYLVGESL